MLSNVRNVSDLARSSEIPEIKVQEEGEQEVSFPLLSEEFDVYQKCLTSTHEQASRRSSRTSTCSHTLSIHAETASAVSFEDIMAETKTSVTLNIPSPTATVGFFAFASSNSSPRMRKNPNIDKAEHSTSTTVSAEINPQYSSVNFGKQDEPKMKLKVEKKSSLRRNDKDALKKRRFSQPVHLKLNCTPTPNAEGQLVISRSNFDDFLWAMVSVFQVLTQENWNRVMYDGMRSTNKWAALYFTTLMAVGYYVLFNLLVAILVEGFTNSGKENLPLKNEGKMEKPDSNSETINKPHIVISYCDSNESCPGSSCQEATPEFCGHGVRNALGM
ncbi:unnamed protein product [Porites evermanni]|uniref:Ion transport domain-containing protein n=1 Tax=Porites evermanni TaxID=104178 RepID=A0ABN8SVS9_9CNID|nr:unnamed protein product [Porites evermanni]